MLNLYPRHQLQARSIDVSDEDVEVEGYNPFYGIAVVCVSIFLFCVLAASVSVWKALAFALLAALLLGVAGCFAPKGWLRRSGRGASAELVVVTVTAGAARPGYPCAQVNAPPAFAFQCPLEAGGGGETAASSVLCSVCLEDVRGGEMVRQLQARSVDVSDEDVEVEGYNSFYGIAVVCVSIFLFCALAASVSVWKALAFALLAALLLGVAGCFMPRGWLRPSGRGASPAELLVVTVVTATTGPARPGHACAQVNAPPAFAFECPLESSGRGEPAGGAASGVVCSVCLEDVRGGEMVRQLGLVTMPNLLSARSRGHRGGGEGDDGNVGVGNRACYGITACAVALLLFCALAASVSVWMAFAFGALALVAFGVAGCVAPSSWRVGPSDGASSAESEAAAADAAGAARAKRRFGLPKAAISALPTFPYTFNRGAEGDDLESGVGCEPCSVCLEDIQGGELVRQLPACKHLFHVECIDMWLHSHRTCPVCRCNISPPSRKVAAKAAAAAPPAVEAEAESSAEVALPPV
ncbi:hypothetical protein BAE44_0022818 [Dichanthelium oligosanthes]|uniref:RING-type E3 ubiquitin transferase n=1 Tax=Dichanthelium oligosanthes TaxID=888268 RepID=A0A1E5UTG6_9POAL|nr:hypothetical protein BAE44_0022818 [Dichanthelium oligosanthes]